MEFSEYSRHIRKICLILAKLLGVKRNNICFCGLGKKFKKCCYQSPSMDDPALCKALDLAIAYRDSQPNKKITHLPLGVYNKIARLSLERLHCIFPGCSEKCSGCHIVPSNILRKNFGDNCLAFVLTDEGEMPQVIPVNQSGYPLKPPVLCNKHDNDLFRLIDDPPLDLENPEQLFMFVMKAALFSYRKNQYHIGITASVEVFRPYLVSMDTQEKHHTLQISQHLTNQYQRIKYGHDLVEKLSNYYRKESWNSFKHYSRQFSVATPVFFTGLINLSHDLRGRRINTTGEQVLMGINVMTDRSEVTVLLSYPSGTPNTVAMDHLMDQFRELDNQSFSLAINALMTVASEKPILPFDFPLGKEDADTSKMAIEWADDCLKATSSNVFDFFSSERHLNFIVIEK